MDVSGSVESFPAANYAKNNKRSDIKMITKNITFSCDA